MYLEDISQRKSIIEKQKTKNVFEYITICNIIFFFAFSEKHRNENIIRGNNLDTIKNKSNKIKQPQQDSLLDCTVGKDSTCEIHHCKMFKDTVAAIAQWIRYVDLIHDLHYNPFPHGENVLCQSHGITHAIIYICPECVKAMNEYFIKKNYESVYPKGQKRL